MIFLLSWILILALLFILKIKRDEKERIEYEQSSYYKITHSQLSTIKQDDGKWGEYRIYDELKKYEEKGDKFLFNVYIPKNEKETTEIDVLMITDRGLFVFESKRYSGWIFGKENQKMWCETFPAGRGRSHKEHFLNPIMQNRRHIKYLKEYLHDDVPVYSIVVFSGECELKNVDNSITSEVIYIEQIDKTVSELYNNSQYNLSEDKIMNLYNTLYPLTQVDEKVKMQHITNIKNYKSKN